MFSQILVELIFLWTFVTTVVRFCVTSQIATIGVYSVTGLVWTMKLWASMS